MVNLTKQHVEVWPAWKIIGLGMDFERQVAQLILRYQAPAENGVNIGKGETLEVSQGDFPKFYVEYTSHDFLYAYVMNHCPHLVGVVDLEGEPI
jgi:hypothetical protein